MRGLLSGCLKDRGSVVPLLLKTAEALSAAAWSLWRSSICGTMCTGTSAQREDSH